jgi:sortase (surface protein transpeptidase)
LLARRPFAAAAVVAGVIAVAAGAGGLSAAAHHPAARPGPKAAAGVLRPLGTPDPLPAPSATTPPGRPVGLTIPAIGVRSRLIKLGITAKGTLQVPASTSVAGWYTGSPRPGAIGSSVIAGHIDSYVGPGVFYRLRDLRPGDRVYVRESGRVQAVFSVDAVHMYAKKRFPTALVYGPSPDPELRLITCGGAFDYATHSYLSNVVVYATLRAEQTLS